MSAALLAAGSALAWLLAEPISIQGIRHSERVITVRNLQKIRLAAAAIQFWIECNALSEEAKTLIGLLATPALALINAVGYAPRLTK